jgi:putative ABC transport system ATP-binding protein
MFTNEKKSAINAKVEQLLQRVGLSERVRHFPSELSGGQIQRAAIARALINNPRIILADEPTGNLDSTNSQSIIDLFRAIRDTLGTTIIVVTHDAAIAQQADRIIELKDGAIL